MTAKKPADEEAVRELIQGRRRYQKVAGMTEISALNALEAALGVKRYEYNTIEYIVVSDLLAAIRGALEGNDAG